MQESDVNSYKAEKVVGHGSFGVVYKALDTVHNDYVAIKKIFQDKKYKNREHTIIKQLDHPNIVEYK